jgi:transcriptional regulator CtsR
MVSLQEREAITPRERLLIEVSLRSQEEQGRVLFDLPPYKRDTLRADLLKRILVSLAMS